MASFYPSTDNEEADCSCGNCAWTGPLSALDPIVSAQDRLTAGEEIPAGECPECGALAYLDSKALENDQNAQALTAARAMLSALRQAHGLHALMTNCGLFDDPQGIHPDRINSAVDAVSAAIAQAEAAGITAEG